MLKIRKSLKTEVYLYIFEKLIDKTINRYIEMFRQYSLLQ